MQVRHAPFMSLSERMGVIEGHRAAVASGSLMHARLEALLMVARGRAVKKAWRVRAGLNAREAVLRGAAYVPGRDVYPPPRAARATSTRACPLRARRYIYNYNTAESALLSCAVFVALSGIMFSSGQFKDPFYDVQRKTITCAHARRAYRVWRAHSANAYSHARGTCPLRVAPV